MILYHCNDGRSFRPLWAIEELGLDCELRVLPFPPRLAAPEYLTENPLGTIPLFVDGTTRMRESVMIGHYLAVKAGSDLAVASDEAEYGRYLDMLAYGETTLTWPQAVALLYGTFPPEADRLPRVVGEMQARLGTVFADLDRLLGAREMDRRRPVHDGRHLDRLCDPAERLCRRVRAAERPAQGLFRAAFRSCRLSRRRGTAGGRLVGRQHTRR